MKANSGDSRRVPRAPGDLAVAVLLALGALAERTRGAGGAHRAWLTAVPLVIVNYVAFRAQLRFWQAHLSRGDALLVSFALESIAVYLAWQAHLALVKDDSALRLRLAAYGTALVIGVLNYSHYMKPGWRPTVAAVTFGLMSAISPWLWSVHSRRESREDLKARHLIEDHAVRLGITRWCFHLFRSLIVMWHATWIGENRPAEAIRLWTARRDRKAAGRHDTPGGPAHSPHDSHRRSGGPAGKSASVTPLTDTNSPAGEAPPPAPVRREPRRAANELREAQNGSTGLAAASRELEQAVLAELLADPGRELPAWRALSRDKFGTGRSHAARRVLEQARAARNGHGEPS